MTAPADAIWGEENWLTYHGDQTRLVGTLMGPTLDGSPCTVVAATYEPGHVWDDRPEGRANRRGRTRLGLVTGDVRSEMGQPERLTDVEGLVTVQVPVRLVPTGS